MIHCFLVESRPHTKKRVGYYKIYFYQYEKITFHPPIDDN